MDDFFDRIKERANNAKDGAVRIGRQVYSKTSNVVSQTKLNFAINESEGKIKELYSKIGQSVYESYLEHGGTDEKFAVQCSKIDELMAEIESMRSKIAELKDSVKCSVCGSYNKEGARYCSKCGEKLTQDESAEDDVIIIDDDAVSEEEGEQIFPHSDEQETEESNEAEEPAAAAGEEADASAEDENRPVRRIVTIKAKRPENRED